MLTPLLLAATSTPSPKAPNADLVTPGVWGFVITLAVAVATILLIWDMMRRVRRTRYRAEVNAKLDAEEARREAEDETAHETFRIEERRSIPSADDDRDEPNTPRGE
ncbi:hypothetical protein [Humibacter albus]|jgi:hypothetical protein|uniref:hypothetical protein n=1 Tax=Humibacter albus TaxID=427754 RepID=UPI0003B6F5D9|nr:hypothetical protein [Humibacter albus]